MKDHEDICAEVRNGLPLHVGGDLEAPAAALITRHLAECATCREHERAAVETRSLLISALQLSERRGPDLWPSVRARLADEDVLAGPAAAPVARLAPVQVRRPRTWTRYAAAAAAALLCGLWLGRALLETPSVEPGNVTDETGLVSAPNVMPTAPVVPVSTEGGLRPIGPHERPLSADSGFYLELPWPEAYSPFDPARVAPAGLRQ